MISRTIEEASREMEPLGSTAAFNLLSTTRVTEEVAVIVVASQEAVNRGTQGSTKIAVRMVSMATSIE